MPDIFDDVGAFHIKFGLTSDEPLQPEIYRGEEMTKFRTGFSIEEAREHKEAVLAGDLVKAVDANLDQIYVAVGNLRLLGVGPALGRALWDLVQRANMAKVRAERASDSTRGTAFDVVKPPGWVSPEPAMRELLREHGALV